MIEVELKARNRRSWNDWKLGDSIIAISALRHLNDDIVLKTKNKSEGIILIESLCKIYNINIEIEIGTSNHIMYPDEYLLENNVSIVKYSKEKEAKGYNTLQTKSKSLARSLNLSSVLDYNCAYINLDNAKEKYGLEEMFDVVNNANKHIGIASGICLVAISTDTECDVYLKSQHRKIHTNWDYAMEIIYRNIKGNVLDFS